MTNTKEILENLQKFIQWGTDTGSIPMQSMNMQTNKITDLIDVLADCAETIKRLSVVDEEWKDITEWPKEGEVVFMVANGVVGIGYVYNTKNEFPQWNFMTLTMNAVGLVDKDTKWRPLPKSPPAINAFLQHNGEK